MDLRRVLLGVAAHGLPTADVALPGAPLEPAHWARVKMGIDHQRLTGQGVAAAADGALVLTDEQRQQLEDDHLAAMAHALRMERQLCTVDDVLIPRGIAFAVLKGTAVAHLDYANPAQRGFGDVDVLIPTEQWGEALAALFAAGYDRPTAEVGPGFDTRFGKGATLVAAGGQELDVHRTLVMGPFGLLVDLAELWDNLEPFELGGRRFAALGSEQRLLHACFHAVIGNAGRRVLPYRDVAEMTLFGTYDADRLIELARHWRAEAVVAQAITETWDALGMTQELPLHTWARSRGVSRWEQRMLAVYTPQSSYAAKAVAAVTVLPRWRDRVDFVRTLALPTRDTGRGRLGWLVRGARRVARDARRARAARG